MATYLRYTCTLLAALCLLAPVVGFTQNVGIGTPTPQNKLDVDGWLRLGDETTGANPGAGAVRYHSAGFLEYHDGTAWQRLEAGWQLQGNTGTNVGTNYLGTADNEDLSIRTNATEAIRVDQNQNVGIGDGNPGAKLEVYQDGSAISDGIRIRGGNSVGDDWYFFKDGNDNLIIRDDASDVMSFRNGTDNVGVGTNTPEARMHI